MSVIEKVIAAMALTVLFHTLTYSVVLYLMKLMKRLKIAFAETSFNLESARSDVKNGIKKYSYLDNFFKWRIWTYFTSSALFFLLKDNPDQIGDSFKLVILSVLLIAIGEFIHSSILGGKEELLFYFMKCFVIIIYPIGFVRLFLNNTSNTFILLLSIVVILSYSFLFVKYVIDSFYSYLF
ncbi:hypothetical protein [Halobacillus halophilus]|uniref:hypothetical protein n=1 Tax=Halobacillus halophilus TaxID=1570 RepID=UPI0011AB8728|nr:hypothetical protein [Halobacillus halophilus]